MCKFRELLFPAERGFFSFFSFSLIEEVGELEHTIRALELKSEESEEKLRDLQHTRLALEKEINVKRNTIGIDRNRVQKVRGLFPSSNLLCGYKK